MRKIWLKILVWSTHFGLHPKLPKPKQIERPFIWRPRIRSESLLDGELLVEFQDAGCEFIIRPLGRCTNIELVESPAFTIHGTPDEIDKILDPRGYEFQIEKREVDGKQRWS